MENVLDDKLTNTDVTITDRLWRIAEGQTGVPKERWLSTDDFDLFCSRLRFGYSVRFPNILVFNCIGGLCGTAIAIDTSDNDKIVKIARG